MNKKNKAYLLGTIGVLCTAAIAWGGINYFQKSEKPYTTDSSAMLADVEWTMDRSIGKSDLIATVEVTEKLSNGVNGTVKQSLMGQSVAEEVFILVNPEDTGLEVGETYLFLLTYVDSFAFPKNCYMTEGVDSVYEIKMGGKLEGPSQVADMRITREINTLEKLTQYVQSTPKAKALAASAENQVPDSFDSIQAMYDASDVVARITLDSVYPENERVSIVEFTVVEQFKGAALGTEQGQFLPAGAILTEGKDCFVFYEVKESGAVLPAAREGAVIGEEDTAWEAVKEFLESQS